MKDTLKANTYLFNVMSSPLKNVKRLKTINNYLLILELSVEFERLRENAKYETLKH